MLLYEKKLNDFRFSLFRIWTFEFVVARSETEFVNSWCSVSTSQAQRVPACIFRPGSLFSQVAELYQLSDENVVPVILSTLMKTTPRQFEMNNFKEIICLTTKYENIVWPLFAQEFLCTRWDQWTPNPTGKERSITCGTGLIFLEYS